MRRKDYCDALLEYGFEPRELRGMSLEELKNEYESVTDTSGMHPNESFDDFIEHEDF